MNRHIAVSSVLILVALTGGCVKHAPLRNVAERCPLPAGARGYPVSATSSEAGVDSIFLREVARAVARRFSGTLARPEKDTLPSPAIDAMTERVEDGEVLWRRWGPTVNDTGRIILAYRRAATRPELRLTHAGRPTGFEMLLQQTIRRAMLREDSGRPHRDPFPMVLPAGGPDSALITVVFGSEPLPGAGVARFAMQERDVRVKGIAHPPAYPDDALFRGREGDVMLAYVVGPDGTADNSTVLIVRSTGDEFAEAAIAALPTYRYLPAQKDCRDVAQLVRQPFTFRMGRPPKQSAPTGLAVPR